jgi:Flp pilus assembly protein TadB
MIIWPLISLIGLLFVDRTISDAETLRLFPKTATSYVRIPSFFALIVLNWLMHDHLLALWLLFIVVILTPMIAIRLIQSRREHDLKNDLIPILDNLTMAMRSGKGFRAALILCLTSREKSSQWAFQEFMSSMEYGKSMFQVSSDRQIIFFFTELALIDQVAHKQIERVKALRQRLFIEKNLRQRSRQALMQVKFQSGMISVMFAGLLAFVHFHFGIQNHQEIVFSALALFLPGLFWIHNIGKGYKWKL